MHGEDEVHIVPMHLWDWKTRKCAKKSFPGKCIFVFGNFVFPHLTSRVGFVTSSPILSLLNKRIYANKGAKMCVASSECVKLLCAGNVIVFEKTISDHLLCCE